MGKIIAIVDCNNFYVSCERVFRPDLRYKPVVVLSNNDGCIIARSNEVKELGISMGVPYFQVKEKLKALNCEVFSSNYTLYGDMSDRVMKTLMQFAENLELYSIDEAFLDLSHIPPKNLLEFGRQIKETVYQNTGIPVSIGIAETKSLAKLANEIVKKDGRGVNKYGGVLNLYQNLFKNDFLKSFPVSDVWGVGRQYAKKLKANKIEDAYALSMAPKDWVKKHFTIQGLRMVQELQGISCIDLETISDPKKGIISSRSFGRPITDLDDLKQAVATYTSRIGEKLRKQGSVAGFIHVFVVANRFKPNSYYSSASMPLSLSTDYTADLVKHSLELLEKIYREGYTYQKAGVMVQNISSNTSIQLNLFDNPTPGLEKQRDIMKVIDKMNKRYGSNTLKLGSLGLQTSWQLKANIRSPRYTTSWNELLRVN